MSLDAGQLLGTVLAAGQTVVLEINSTGHLQSAHNAILLDDWCDRDDVIEGRNTLQDLLGSLAGVSAVRELVPLINGAIAAQASERPDPAIGTLRVRASGGIERHIEIRLQRRADDCFLLLLRDITARGEAQLVLATAQLSLDTAMACLRAAPKALRLFLGASMASVGAIRATMRLPARSQAALRDKLARLRADVDRLEGEARQIHLAPVMTACQGLSAQIAALLQQGSISGDAVLPLSLLIDQVASATGTAWRIEEQRYSPPPAAAEKPAVNATRPRRPADWAKAIERRWAGYLRRRGEEAGTLVRLAMEGAQHVPVGLRRPVDEILQHLVSNAIAHGIETPEERLAADKPAAGQITIRFEDQGRAGLRMTVRDDGRGFDTARIGRAAVNCGLVSEESLLERNAADVVGLIFRPDFTTEGLDGEDAGGRGMSFLRRTVARLGGQVSVATKAGRYTQFNIQLPAALHLVDADSA